MKKVLISAALIFASFAAQAAGESDFNTMINTRMHSDAKLQINFAAPIHIVSGAIVCPSDKTAALAKHPNLQYIVLSQSSTMHIPEQYGCVQIEGEQDVSGIVRDGTVFAMFSMHGRSFILLRKNIAN